MDTPCAAYLALLTCYSGLLGLCLAIDRHHVQILQGKPGWPRRQLLRLSGWTLLGVALWLCSLTWGWAIGPVAWCGLLSAAALALVFLLAYAPRFAAWLIVVSLLPFLPPAYL